MAGFTNTYENAVLNHVMMKTALSQPSRIDVALWIGDPGEDLSGGAEVSGGNYSRVATTASDWNTASGGVISNAVDLEFPQASADWGTVTHVVLFDYNSGSPIGMLYGALGTSKEIKSGDTAKFYAGSLTISFVD